MQYNNVKYFIQGYKYIFIHCYTHILEFRKYMQLQQVCKGLSLLNKYQSQTFCKGRES